MTCLNDKVFTTRVARSEPWSSPLSLGKNLILAHSTLDMSEVLLASKSLLHVLSSSVKPGTHFLENNKIIGVFTMLKLCVSKEGLA